MPRKGGRTTAERCASAIKQAIAAGFTQGWSAALDVLRAELERVLAAKSAEGIARGEADVGVTSILELVQRMVDHPPATRVVLFGKGESPAEAILRDLLPPPSPPGTARN